MAAPEAVLQALQNRLGHQFKNLRLLQAALKHSSSADHRRDSNERMEFLGDQVMGIAICNYLYQELPEAQEGELTKIKSAVVSRASCARVGRRLALGDALSVGQGMYGHPELPASIIAGTFEAVVAAVFIDGGYDIATSFVLRVMAEELREAIESQHHSNFKSQLQQHAQREFNLTPRYELLDEKGPDHAKCFEVAVSLGDRRFSGAWGPNKKEAEQKAARRALQEMGVVEPDDEEEDAGAMAATFPDEDCEDGD
ncbi:MAG: ribonuclease III [Phycisphaerae bacterium]|nr:ribonuclease III [Phycisphaerae bacterium]